VALFRARSQRALRKGAVLKTTSIPKGLAGGDSLTSFNAGWTAKQSEKFRRGADFARCNP
jgi:hypothetical protein